MIRTHEDTRLTASLTRSNASTGADRLRSIRSRLILGMLLPYVCLMGVCAVVLFTGPAGADRLPALLVLIGAAVLLPAAMARIARSILGQAEALAAERPVLADQVARNEEAVHPVEASVEAAGDAAGEPAAEPSLDPVAEALPAPDQAAPATDDVASQPMPGEIDEDAPLAAAVSLETDADAEAVDEGGPFAAFVAADRGAWAVSSVAGRVTEEGAAVPIAPAVDEDPAIATASSDGEGEAIESAPVDDDAPIAAAVAAPEPAVMDTPEAAPETPPRPMLVPSAIGRQILTGAPAEPAA